MYKFISRVDHLYSKFVASFLVINVIALIFLAIYSIISRWLQLTNLWVDPLNRHLVLLLIFLGSTVAIDKKKHLKIDALAITFEKKVSPHYLLLLELLFLVITSIIVFFLLISGIKFWLSELEYPVDAFLGLQQYHLVLIIPFGFFLMFKKYFLLIMKNIAQLLGAKS